MKKLSRSFILVLVLLLCSVSLTPPAFAAAKDESAQVLKFEDGSYIIITIEGDEAQNAAAPFSNKHTKSGSKNYNFYANTNDLKWVFRVHGTFEYDGVTASAIGTTYSYDIYGDEWSFVDGSATRSGATATATGRFRRVLIPNSVTVSLTCSPSGVLS